MRTAVAGSAGSATRNVVPVPSRLSTVTVPPCISTMLRTIARPEAAAAAACLAGAASRGRSGRRSGQLGGVDADAGVRDGDRPRRRRRSPRTCTSTRPPRGVNLIALPTRFATTWPMRTGSCRIWIGCVGPIHRQLDAAPARRRRRLVDRLLDRRSGGPRAAGRAGRGPESSFDSSSRFWASQSRRSSWARLVSRNSARVVGSSAAPSTSSSLNVRSAAIGVRSSCDTSARNSRLRSRSRRMISMLCWSRSAIALNWRPSSDSSIGPSSIASDGHAPREVALGEVAARLGEAAQRRRDPPREHRRDDDRDRECDEADDREQPGDVLDRGRAVGVRVRAASPRRAYGHGAPSSPRRRPGALVIRSRELAGPRLAPARAAANAPLRRRPGTARRRAMPEPELDVGLGQPVGDDAAAGCRDRARRRRPGRPSPSADDHRPPGANRGWCSRRRGPRTGRRRGPAPRGRRACCWSK